MARRAKTEQAPKVDKPTQDVRSTLVKVAVLWAYPGLGEVGDVIELTKKEAESFARLGVVDLSPVAVKHALEAKV